MMHKKLVLFDIDGTLISPGPLARQILAEAVSQFLGRMIELSFYEVAGFTDPIIVRNALVRHSNDGQPSKRDIDTILEHFLCLVEERFPAENSVKVFPGAEELVKACTMEGWVPALLTGNMERGARVKMADTNMWDLFAFGVFGGDGNAREDLPWVARERAWDVLHEAFLPEHTILVGDTPNDARIGNINRVPSMIVCRRDEADWRKAIEQENPTWLVEDFGDVPGLISMMKNG
ncbi:HAD family hydrolase [Candidatus Neomarinimicrobiota bacterium]